MGASAVCLGAASSALAQRGDAYDTKLRSPEETRTLLRVPPGFDVQLVSSEPDIQKPMNLAFDAAGRVWITGSNLYPWPARRDALGQDIAGFDKQWGDNALAFRATSAPPEPPLDGTDSVRVLSDFDAHGRARRVTTFADGLNIPIGVLPLPRAAGARGDTALVFSIPAIWRLSDTDGDGRADRREKLYDGFGFKDTHGMSSNYWLWFDGWVYGTHGFANQSEVRDQQGRVTTLMSGHTYRFRPDGSQFEIVTRGQTNPFGLAFDARGDIYTADSHSKPVYLLVPGGTYESLSRSPEGLGYGPPITFDDHGSTAIAGIAHYSARAFPPEFRDNLFNGNPVTRRVNRARLDWRGSSANAVRIADFVASDDPAFRPVQVKLGPDGALWIADFYNPIIGHYEVPLTHPGRNRTHGRIWRVVWRGVDGSVPPPTLPNLAALPTPALAAQLSDPNLVVRSLAAAELFSRPDAPATVPTLRAQLQRLIHGTDVSADPTAALPLFFALDRFGAADDTLIRGALGRRESEIAIAALRLLAGRAQLSPTLRAPLETLFSPPVPEHAARAGAEVFRRHRADWQPPLLLGVLAKTPESDPLLRYALRLALKAHADDAGLPTLQDWAKLAPEFPEHVADIATGVTSTAAAEFLLGHLEQTRFSGVRAGEFARHAVQHLPPDRWNAITPLFTAVQSATFERQAAFAEGIATVAAKGNRPLSSEMTQWLHATLTRAIASPDANASHRAILAVKELSFAEKTSALRAVALDRRASERNRIAALRSLTPGTSEREALLIEALALPGSNNFRRTVADLLGQPDSSPAARAALVKAFSDASADLALSLATALARSDAGASELLDLVTAGRVRPTLLRHRYVAAALEKRPAALRERVQTMTRDLPSEDARLDAIIAQRLAAANTLKGDLTRGAAVFAAQCSVCHSIRNQGGVLGPNLDGLSERTVARLVEDILDPSRNIDPAFRLKTVTLTSGESRSGMNYREQGERALLTDASTGQDMAFSRRDIASVATATASSMPQAFDALLSEQDLTDLLAFLREPRR
jgi:putative heme-binding domain-containing protein